jgi:hypothetical protein
MEKRDHPVISIVVNLLAERIYHGIIFTSMTPMEGNC